MRRSSYALSKPPLLSLAFILPLLFSLYPLFRVVWCLAPFLSPTAAVQAGVMDCRECTWVADSPRVHGCTLCVCVSAGVRRGRPRVPAASGCFDSESR